MAQREPSKSRHPCNGRFLRTNWEAAQRRCCIRSPWDRQQGCIASRARESDCSTLLRHSAGKRHRRRFHSTPRQRKSLIHIAPPSHIHRRGLLAPVCRSRRRRFWRCTPRPAHTGPGSSIVRSQNTCGCNKHRPSNVCCRTLCQTRIGLPTPSGPVRLSYRRTGQARRQNPVQAELAQAPSRSRLRCLPASMRPRNDHPGQLPAMSVRHPDGSRIDRTKAERLPRMTRERCGANERMAHHRPAEYAATSAYQPAPPALVLRNRPRRPPFAAKRLQQSECG